MSISKRASSITPSLTLSITAKAKKLKEEGVSIIGFGAGEPDFGTPDYIVEEAKRALDEGYTKYTEAKGILALRENIAEKLKKDNGLTYDPSQIIVSNGAKHSLYNALFAIIDEEDEVIIPSPYWLTYPELVSMCGGVSVFVPCKEENGFKMTAEELNNAITSKTKAVILNSPCNPTGAVYSKEELDSLARVLENENIYVIADEIYEKLVYGNTCHYSIASYSPKIKDKTILINGMSKTYSMTGWRIGYLAANSEVAKAVNSIQSHMTSNPNTIAQYAASAAFENGGEFLNTMVKTFDERRKYIFKRTNEIEGLSAVEPNGAFYIFVNVSKLIGRKWKGVAITDSIDLANKMLEAGVAVIPGKPFGDDNYFRLSYAISLDDIIEGMNRIERFVKAIED